MATNGVPELSNRDRVSISARMFEWGLQNVFTSREVDGLQLFAIEDAMLDRVEAALSLIREFDPLRYRRILKDLDRILVTLLPGSIGQFSTTNWTCTIDKRFVLRESTTPELIASVIVHEATHARLNRRSIGYPESLRERIEDLCFYQEWLLGNKLPNGDEVRTQAERYLNEPPPDFSDSAMNARRDQGAKQALRTIGLSEKWARRLIILIKWLAWMRRRFRPA
ncbi:hypothetical protein [Allomesorhizobium alhagi]|jgi:hypothetical protein|uniref:Uncharacterized protein n=1 Tax=Mesorhizobium alhagi CCNWXJ12-2 TaxID=1107882 RepID=H0HMX2_9HYPH|nr:hypothetical protein [Mesorhizobium alhagi]EHK57937.1 hypothetical protein MAXJ12_07442 [Mesorhizobium alhagi CCNWXJ12-2]